MLRHKNKEKFEDFIWHWFLVIGYCLAMIQPGYLYGRMKGIGEINEKEIV